MAKTKLKNAHPQRNWWLFLVLWLTGHILAWVPFFVFDNVSNDLTMVLQLALFMGGITSLTQYGLIRWQFGRNLKWWLPLSMAAWFLTAIFPFQASLDLNYTQLNLTIQALLLFVPATVVQMFLLRKYVKQSWLWVLAAVAGTSVFGMSAYNSDGGFWAAALAYGAYASATGLTLLWLFGMSRQPDKLKDTNAAEARLSDSDHSHETVDHIEEIQAQQSTMR